MAALAHTVLLGSSSTGRASGRARGSGCVLAQHPAGWALQRQRESSKEWCNSGVNSRPRQGAHHCGVSCLFVIERSRARPPARPWKRLDFEPQRYEFTSGIKFSPRAVRVERESARW